MTSSIDNYNSGIKQLTRSINQKDSFLNELGGISDQHGKDSHVRLKNGHFKVGQGSNFLKNIFSGGRYQSERKEAAQNLGITKGSISVSDSIKILEGKKNEAAQKLVSLNKELNTEKQNIQNIKKELEPITAQLKKIELQETADKKAAEKLTNQRNDFSAIYQSNAGCKAINSQARYLFGASTQAASLSSNKVIAEYERVHGSDIFSKGNKELKFTLKSKSEDLSELVKTAAKNWYTPSEKSTTTYRGQGMTQKGLEALVEQFNADKNSSNVATYQLGQFFSTSSNPKVAQNFATQSQDEHKIMFMVKGNSGSGIAVSGGLRFNNDESEVLYSPHANFTVTKLTHSSKNNTYNVTLEEVKPQQGAKLLPY
ncbi:ADP-ribosyltransferase domain-containing protein [Providencia zhijiangensis]|uniref:NAD(+)--protein-arginine ADP-ribosyltransferase n=1 Tax=Providencia zhijiangensis TaxID=3053982 RepID=A0ABZ0N5U3_9GAMM|nr:ADP-ribosyltransferase domain-containing protein [Providencia sp. D4759]WPA93773.1 ADP-ribosyltransferase domain-containing protein [Providencia sp. D4759]